MTTTIDTIVKINVREATKSFGGFNLNTFALITHETPAFSEDYKFYNNHTNVGIDFGTNSITYQMAKTAFMQDEGFYTAGGGLLIIPTSKDLAKKAESATRDSITTIGLTANLANFQAAKVGNLRFTLQGNSFDIMITDLDKATTMEKLRLAFENTIKKAITTSKVSNVIVKLDGDKLVFESAIFGTNSSIAIASVPSGTLTDLTGANYLDIVNATQGATPVNSSGEKIMEVINRTKDLDNVFYSKIITTLDLEDQAILDLASDLQALSTVDPKMMFFITYDTEYVKTTGLAKQIADLGFKYTRILTHIPEKINQTIEDGRNFLAAYVSFFLKDRNNNESTLMTHKTLKGVQQGIWNNDLFYDARDNGADIYRGISIGEVRVSESGANTRATVIRDISRQKFVVLAALYNLIASQPRKLGQTASSIDQIESVVRTALKTFVAQDGSGVIAPGFWNSNDFLGSSKELFRAVIQQEGFYVRVEPIESQTQAERESGAAPRLSYATKGAGGIETIEGFQVYEQ